MKSLICINCSVELKISQKGMCKRCYDKQRIKNFTPEQRVKLLQRRKEVRKLNPESEKAKAKRYNATDSSKKARKSWRLRNKDRMCYHSHKRHKRSFDATPDWVDENELLNIFLNKPKDNEIDHIIPLSHEAVCGLHVPWNMQYLEKSLNRQKKNKFDYTYENTSWQLDVKQEYKKIA